jgi:hypothetical protein
MFSLLVSRQRVKKELADFTLIQETPRRSWQGGEGEKLQGGRDR